MAQKALPLWAGLVGTNASFPPPPPGVWGNIRGETVPTRGLLRWKFRGATGICGLPAIWCFGISSEPPRTCLTLLSVLPDGLLLLLLLLPWGLSSILILGTSEANSSPLAVLPERGLEERDWSGCGWQSDHIPADLSGPSGPGGWWWWTGWGRREDGWGMRDGRERGPHREEVLPPDPPELPSPPPPPPILQVLLELLPPGRPALLLLLGGPLGPPPPTWFLWYSIGDVKAVGADKLAFFNNLIALLN